MTITAVGDMMLGNTPDLPPDPGTYFRAVKPALTHRAQIVFGNLEGTLTTVTSGKCGNARRPSHNCFAFRTPPEYARYFKQAGFTVLNNANNHSFDFGAAGQAQTITAIHAAGLAQTGLPGQITPCPRRRRHRLHRPAVRRRLRRECRPDPALGGHPGAVTGPAGRIGGWSLTTSMTSSWAARAWRAR